MAEAGLDFELAAVGFDDAADDGEAESGAFGFGGGEDGGEGAAALFFGHAGAGVFEVHDQMGGLSVGPGHGAGGNGEAAAFGHGFDGVEDEVEEGLLQLRGVAEHERQIGLEIAHELDVLVGELVPH